MTCLRRRSTFAGAALVCLLGVASIACAEPDGSWPPAGDAPIEGRAWLVRSHDAASHRNYQGVLVTTVAGQSSSARVAHYYEGRQQAERIESLDGEARQVLRLNDQVHTVWPRSRLAVVEARDVRTSFPSLLSGSDRRVLDWYEWRLTGQDRVAGYDAEVVLLKARDPWRFSQRLWAERQTGLLLRVDMLAPNGQVLESAAFSELSIGVRPQIDAVQAAVKKLEGYRLLRPATLPVSLDSEGWQLGALPAGFREVRCARRVLGPQDDPRSPTVLHAVFSDGLTHVSLFIEPFQAERHQARVSAPVGATRTLMTRRDQQWVTLVGDVPEDTLQRFADALVRKR